jgi:membrane-associated protease RseP (regulator of RpoE activity)
MIEIGLGPIPSERPTYAIGVVTSPVDPLLRAQLQLPDGQGLAIRHVDEKGPAAEAGLVHGDILLTLNGKPLDSEQTLYTSVQSEGEKPVTLELIHNGSRQRMTLSPVRRKADTIHIKFISEHDLMKRGISDPAQAFTFVRKMNSPDEKPMNVQGNLIGTTFTALPALPLAVSPVTGQQIDVRLKALTTAGKPKSSDPVAKRLDAMTAQIDSLRKAVDELAKAIKDKK